MAARETYQDLMDCPALRLGNALRTHREAVGVPLEEISKRVDFAFTPLVLEMIEAGMYPLDSAQVLIVVWGYDADPDRVLPPREQLHVDTGRQELAAGPTIRELHESATPAGVLYEYLAFVYQIREVEPGSSVPLRDADLAILANTTGWEIEEVREHLTTLMSRWHEALPHETQSGRRQNRTGLLGAAVPVGLLERFHRNDAD